MRRIRSRDTGPEREWRSRNVVAADHPALPFSPDFLDLHARPVFVDSDFWHCTGKMDFAGLSESWQRKLLRNLARDLSADSFYAACRVEVERV